jgi:RimJ/RimL family protein N-acetyltransferase
MLIGKQVCLSELTDQDRDKLFAWINTAPLVRLGSPFRPVHAPEHRDWFKRVTEDRERVIFGIRVLPGRTLIGVVQLINLHPVHRNAELLIRIGARGQHGQGYGVETVRMILAFAWNDLNLHRVTAQAFADNRRAIACYAKAGFAEEGRLREAAYVDGRWKAIVVMGAVNPQAARLRRRARRRTA